MAELPDREELYLLRVQDKALAARLRGVLQQSSTGANDAAPTLDLRFATQGGADLEARTGEFRVGGESYSVKRQDLPTVVECFKTYDDTNLVKSGDIGQVILVPNKGSALPEGTEARNGVTPPMKDAVKRRFRRLPDVDPGLMRQVEDAALIIAAGSAPEGYEFVDVEEEYVVAEDGRSGSWRPYEPGRVPQQTPEAAAKRGAKRRTKRKPESAEQAASQDEATAQQRAAGASEPDIAEEEEPGDGTEEI